MPTRIGIPKGLYGLVDEIETPAYAASMGLILYGLKTGTPKPSRPGLPHFTPRLGKLPGKGLVNKLIDLAKSFLP